MKGRRVRNSRTLKRRSHRGILHKPQGTRFSRQSPRGGLGQERWSTSAPFRGLSAVSSVVTSNDDYRIWLHWPAERLRIRYPDGRSAFEQHAGSAGGLDAWLSVQCRADGRGEGLPGPEPARSALWLPMYPEPPAVYQVLHPMFWLLGLTGSEVERTPVRVVGTGVAAFDAELVRQRTDYSFPRPALRVDLPAAAVLESFVAGAAIQIDLSGERVDARLWFAARSDPVEPPWNDTIRTL